MLMTIVKDLPPGAGHLRGPLLWRSPRSRGMTEIEFAPPAEREKAAEGRGAHDEARCTT